MFWVCIRFPQENWVVNLTASSGLFWNISLQKKSFHHVALHHCVYKSECLHAALWGYSDLNFARDFMQLAYSDFELLSSSKIAGLKLTVTDVTVFNWKNYRRYLRRIYFAAINTIFIVSKICGRNIHHTIYQLKWGAPKILYHCLWDHKLPARGTLRSETQTPDANLPSSKFIRILHSLHGQLIIKPSLGHVIVLTWH